MHIFNIYILINFNLKSINALQGNPIPFSLIVIFFFCFPEKKQYFVCLKNGWVSVYISYLVHVSIYKYPQTYYTAVLHPYHHMNDVFWSTNEPISQINNNNNEYYSLFYHFCLLNKLFCPCNMHFMLILRLYYMDVKNQEEIEHFSKILFHE